MTRIFYVPDISKNPVLPEEESQHCVRVLRMKEGETINVTDGKGYFYETVLTDANPKHCMVSIKNTIAQKPLWKGNIHIAVAPTKNIDRMEWFVEKAIEIGINTITFLNCQYSERREIKIARMEKIAISAMKQSQKATLPQINKITDFKEFIKQHVEGCKMIAHCEETEKNLIKDIYKPGNNATILIGPEGDFSSEEIESAEKYGFMPISLGKSRLRTETAALVACHTLHVINQK